MCKHRFTIFLSLFSLLLVILSSCVTKSKDEEPTAIPSYLIDRSWLNDEPCKAPCWYELEPGKSNKEESISLVKTLPFINPDSMTVTEIYTNSQNGLEQEGIPSQRISFEYRDSPKNICIEMMFENDILEWFVILPIYNISFKEIVDQIGPPDYFSYSRSYPEGKGCDVSLLWVERQIQVTYYEEMRGMFGKDICDRIQKANNKIPTDLDAFHVLFIQKNWIEEKISGEIYIPWSGFINPTP